MNIPEIASLVGGLLTRSDLASCVKVCKTWNKLLTPLVYKRVDLLNLVFPEATLACHGHLIQKLVISNGTPGIIGDAIYTSSLRESEKDNDPPGTPIDFSWTRVCLNLRELTLGGLNLSPENTQRLLELVPQLSVLKLVNCDLQMNEATANLVESSRPYTDMKELTIFGCRPSELAISLVEGCPNVRLLENDSYFYHHEPTRCQRMSGVLRFVRPPLFSQLQSLTLRGVLDSEMALILDSCPPMQRICVRNSFVWYMFMQSMERHFETIEHLDVSGCTYLRSWMLQRILVSSPRLRYFASVPIGGHELVVGLGAEHSRAMQRNVHEVSDRIFKQRLDAFGTKQPGDIDSALESFRNRDTTTVQPWACLGLRSLTLPIRSVDRRWGPQIFEQLSRLTELQHLDCRPCDQGVDHIREILVAARKYPNLSFNPNSGCEQLISIRKLDTLYLDECISEKHLRWMRDQWPAIKIIVPKGRARSPI